MANASPSSKKVDDFLSSISQLSQERLKEDQQRQRELQRNIDELRLRLNSSSPVKSSSTVLGALLDGSKVGYGDIPLMKFNRNLRLKNSTGAFDFGNAEDEMPPPMPKRPEEDGRPSWRVDDDDGEEMPPPMPPRRDFKKAPFIPSKPASMTSKFDIELINPVARKPTSELPARGSTKENRGPVIAPTGDRSYRSFADLERNIKRGEPIGDKTKDIVDETMNAKRSQDYRPLKPSKSDKLSAMAPNKHDPVPKPSYLSALSATHSGANKTRQAQESASDTKQRYIPQRNKPSDVSITRSPSPKRGKKPHSWLDSAIRKNDTAEPETRKSPGEKQLDLEYASRFHNMKSSDKPVPPKPSKPSLDKYVQRDNELLKSQMQKLSSSGKTLPPRPSKPSIDKYEKQDAELLRSQLLRLSPLKNVPPKPSKASKPSADKYKDDDNEKLRSNVKKLGKYPTASRSGEHEGPEGLAALAKLKPVKKPEPKSLNNPRPEAIGKKEQIKTGEKSSTPTPTASQQLKAKTGSASDLTEKATTEPPPATFQDHLSSIIRASTTPKVSAKPSASIARTKSEPLHEKKPDTSGDKLTHPNKGRSRGPKRRLPKKMAGASSEGATEKAANTDDTDHPATITDYKLKKTPPPISKASKQRAVSNLKPSRNFSGELFI